MSLTRSAPAAPGQEPVPFGSERSEREGPAQAIESRAIPDRSDDPIRSGSALAGTLAAVHRAFAAIPDGLIAVVARFSIAAVFWKSGQTKVEGFAIDLVDGTVQLGWPRLGPSTVELFRDEYKLPILPPELAAVLATVAEHVLPVLILIGLATRLSAFALLVMTLVIQVLVYPGAYPVHGTWAAVLLVLMAKGAGPLSLDALIARGR